MLLVKNLQGSSLKSEFNWVHVGIHSLCMGMIREVCLLSSASSASNSFSAMTLITRQPFPSLSADNFLSQGGAGQVFAINKNVAFKCPVLFEVDNLPPESEAEMKENIMQVENEKKIYELLKSHPHPNLLYGILCVSEGIFMPRLETTLAACLASSTTGRDVQERWIRQLVSAATWLESLGYVHGDLRPENILLDKLGNIRVADFDATVPAGTDLRLATLPFCKVDENFEPPAAGPESEQFSLGSCIYNIRFGYPPFTDLGLDSPVWRKMLAHKEFPSTSDDLFGAIIQNCWHGTFSSISSLEAEVIRLTGVHPMSPSPPIQHLWYLFAECQEYVSRQRLRLGRTFFESLQLRCRVIIWVTIRAGLSLFYHDD